MLKTDFKNEQKQKRILFYIRGMHHCHLVYNIAKNNPKYQFYFTSNYLKKDDYIRSVLYPLDNCFFVEDIKNLYAKLPLFGLFITTDCQMTAAHWYSLNISRLFTKLNVKTVELEHGLFQLGLDYFDLPSGVNFYNDSLPTSIVADVFLSYGKEPRIPQAVCIGYPPYEKTRLNSYTGNYTLILSNLHWETYTDVEKYRFYETIIRLVSEHPERLFVWRQHPGEKNSASCKRIYSQIFSIIAPRHQNLIIENKMFDNIITEELIAKAKNIISTVSTTLLDCEIEKKDTYVYACETNASLIEKLSKSKTFSSYEELSSIFDKKAAVVTGKLNPYNNKAFQEMVEKNYHQPELDKAVYLDDIVQYK